MSNGLRPGDASVDSFFGQLIGDGRSLFKVLALALIGSGTFVLFQAATGHFLPHDTAYLGMDAGQLCKFYGCRVVHFMMHDRVSFGGLLLPIGVMYLWLAEFPLRRRGGVAWVAAALRRRARFLSRAASPGYRFPRALPWA